MLVLSRWRRSIALRANRLNQVRNKEIARASEVIADSWRAFADCARRNREASAGRLCFFGDIAACSKLRYGRPRVDLAAFVEEFIEVAVGEHPPVETARGSDVLRVASDRRRAVLRQCVVPFRMVGKLIRFVEVIDQQTLAPAPQKARSRY